MANLIILDWNGTKKHNLYRHSYLPVHYKFQNFIEKKMKIIKKIQRTMMTKKVSLWKHKSI